MGRGTYTAKDEWIHDPCRRGSCIPEEAGLGVQQEEHGGCRSLSPASGPASGWAESAFVQCIVHDFLSVFTFR